MVSSESAAICTTLPLASAQFDIRDSDRDILLGFQIMPRIGYIVCATTSNGELYLPSALYLVIWRSFSSSSLLPVSDAEVVFLVYIAHPPGELL